MEKWIELGKEFGLKEKELLDFVKDQQEIERRKVDDERQERQRERDIKKLESEERERQQQRELEVKEREREAQAREKEAVRRHELEMKQLEVQAVNTDGGVSEHHSGIATAKMPKLPQFIDGQDDLDSYLQRFERFAKSNKWNESIWATSLSALLTGKALDVYSRMLETAAVDYIELKEALLKRYDLTENGFRVRFRNSKPEEGESPEQFITRLKRYLTRWIDLAKTEKSFEALCELFVKEQLIDACPEDLAIYLRERDPENLDEAAKVAEQFLIAHGKKLHSPSKPPKGKYPPSGSTGSEKGGKPGGRMQCFTCGGYGHKAIECSKNPNKSPPKVEKRCFLCDRTGHLARECKLMRDKKNTEKAGAALHDQGHPPENDTSLESCVHGDQLLLRNGKTLPFIKSGSVSLVDSTVRKMPIVRGRVGENIVVGW